MAPPVDTDTLVATRLSLHAVAEHVLSPGLHAVTGKIGLRQTPGGFGTPPFATQHGDRRLRVDGTDLVVTDDRGEQRRPLTTVRAAAAFAEVEPGAPDGVYTPTTALDLDAPLTVDPVAAEVLADFYARTNDALERFRDAHAADEPSIVQLWPEHFDLATTLAEVDYGGSPGDAGNYPVPYYYVGPWNKPEPGGFWNASFGAAALHDTIASTDAAFAFFDEGHRLLTNP